MNNVLSRPLFRQAGGSVLPQFPGLSPTPLNSGSAPPAMPPVGGPGVSMPPVGGPNPAMAAQNPVEQAEREAGAEMEKVGAEYMSGVFSGIDNAETAEDLINALRGDDRPIQSRYEELAMIVGPEDASNTPDSVLALAQPGIMMAMPEVDSGIGMLVEDLASGAEMVTPEGAPTDMGQGVGGLMMAGAGPIDGMPIDGAPIPMGPGMGGAPQYLAYGGPVIKKFNTAGAVTSEPEALSFYDPEAAIEAAMAGVSKPIGITQQYDTLLPLYQGLVGSSDSSRKAQSKLAIAKAAFDWGSGKYAGQGRSPFAQGAGAISDTLPTLAALSAQRDKSDQAVKLAALKSASDLETAARTGQISLAEKKLDFLTPGTTTQRSVQGVSDQISNLMRQVRKKNKTKFTLNELNDPRGPEAYASRLLNAKMVRNNEDKFTYTFTGPELDFIEMYLNSFDKSGAGSFTSRGQEFITVLRELVKEGKQKPESLGKTTRKMVGIGEAIKKAAGGPVIQNFEEGTEVKRPIGTGLKDPGNPTTLFGVSNILPSIGNYVSGMFEGDLYDPGQRAASNYYTALVSEYNRTRGDIIGSLTESDRMSTFREPELAKTEQTEFPPTGSLHPATWMGNEAAYADIADKRQTIEARIDALYALQDKYGTPESALTDTQFGTNVKQITQLESLRNQMDVFLVRMKKEMGGQSGARAMRKQAAEDVNKMIFGDPRSAN